MTDAIDQAQALQALRREIDGLDQELLTLLNRRAECALEVAVVKEQSICGRTKNSENQFQVSQMQKGIFLYSL